MLETKTLKFFEWDDIREFLCEQMDLPAERFRDAACKYGKDAVPGAEYQDFWHVWLWIVDNRVYNDSWMPYYNIYGESDLDYFKAAMKEEFGEWAWRIIPALNTLAEQSDSEQIVIHYSW